MKLELDFTPLDDMFVEMNKQVVIAGVLSETLKAERPDYSQPLTTKTDSFTGMSYQNNKIKFGTIGKKITVRKLAFILDAKKGIISDVLINPKNKELIEIAKLFATPNKTPNQIKQIQNLSIALIRNPILRKDYGSNNAKYAEKKRFDRWGMNTGRLFRNIKARYFVK